MKINVVSLRINREYIIDIPSYCEYVYDCNSAKDIFCNQIGNLNTEVVAVLCIDNSNKVINYSNVAIGDINEVKVPINQVIRLALLSNAKKMIIAHNHPSGILCITTPDIEMTKKIGAVAKLLDIELLDSLVVNDKDAISIREKIEGKNE